MNRKIFKIFLSGYIVMCLLFTGCNNIESEFTGSMTCNDNRFLVDFEVLNETEEGKITLNTGDKINVTITVEDGSVDVSIKNESGKTIYKSDDAETSSFKVVADENGKFTCSVTGSNARGSVHFVKAGTE